MRHYDSKGVRGKFSRHTTSVNWAVTLRGRLALCWLVAVLFLATSTYAADLIPFGATWRYRLGTEEASSPTDAWRGVAFNHLLWDGGDAPIGFPSSGATGLEGTIRTLLPTGSAVGYRCVFLRKAFLVTNLAEIAGLTLRVQYDDGFAIWLNGVPIGSAGVAEPYTINTLASDHEVTVSEALLTPSPGLLLAGNNVLAVQVFNASEISSDLFLDAQLTSSADEAPIVTAIDPLPTVTVESLTFINVVFSESVSGVDASDLLINNAPATNVLQISPREYQFNFPQPATGEVTVAWIPNPGINDLDVVPGAFVPGPSWTYTLDPNVVSDTPIISEFMADNENGIKDDDGARSDWIEIYNPGPLAMGLEGWFLTDSKTNLARWRFPNVILEPNKYLLVWASEKNRANPTRPLHTNFRLERNGEFLALVDPLMNVVSAFDPMYPAQVADVSYGRDRVDPNVVGYYIVPTPGAQNAMSGPGFTPAPVFSVDSGVFTNDTITVTLSGAAEIRYTLDGSVPTNTSPRYNAPLILGSNVVIKARAFQTGLWPSPVVSRAYHFLDASTRDFNSNLPLIILSTAGRPISQQGIPPGFPRTPGSLVVVDTFRGRSTLHDKSDFIGLAEYEIFGQTSAGFPKQPHRIEIQDELRNDRRVPLLGMPAEADWRLRNPYTEKCLMSDFLTFDLFEEMGHYAVRRRFVEVFVDAGGGKVTYPQDYYGVMVLMESIEAGPNRVNIAEVTPFHTTEPEITGGYVWKNDKDSQGDLNFIVGGAGIGTAQTLKLHEPKPQSMRKVPATAITTYVPNNSSITNYTPSATNQLNYLIRYLNAFITSMQASDWLTRTGTNHYSHYVDVDSLVDHHWIVEFTKNIDGYRISNFMYKDRGRKIKMEPLWDWELSWGNADYLQCGLTNGWYYPQLGASDHIWLRRLVGSRAIPNTTEGDPDFIQKLIDRWGELRTGALNGPQILARIDEIAALLTDNNAAASPMTRNFTKYNILNTYVWPNPQGPPANHVDYTQPTYGGIISELKKWTLGRFLWLDSQFPKAPIFSLSEGDITVGSSLNIAAPAGTVYYTLDGTDPRLSQAAGAVSPAAMTYSEPVLLNDNTRVFARARVGNVWSPPAVATYMVRRPRLVITEIMYHPLPPPPGDTNTDEAFEYLEFKNVGDMSLDLEGFTLSGGVDFTFSARTLAVGERVLVVNNQAAFLSRYPGLAGSIAGEFTGNLANDGERLVLRGRLREPVLDFAYDDAWHPITDGFGFSLVIVDENATANTWSLGSSWRPGGVLNGTPGQGEGAAPNIPRVVVNEALTHSDPPPPTDTIELLNLSGSPASVAGWYLTDNFREPMKYRIPLNTPAIPPGGFLTFDESAFNVDAGGNIAFSLSSSGDEVYLFSADAEGDLSGYVHGFAFGPQRSGVTFGRHVTSEGEERFVAETAVTLGSTNTGPLVGPMVISEIMYRPPDVFANGLFWDNTEEEYIELFNRSAAPVNLFDPAHPADRWRLGEAVDFEFPPDTTIVAGGDLVVVGFDPTAEPERLSAFRAWYNVPVTTLILGPYRGTLRNTGATVALFMPNASAAGDSDESGVLVEQVRYSPSLPWPVAANEIGFALHRLDRGQYADDPANWEAAAPTPGRSQPPGPPPVIASQPEDRTVVTPHSVSFAIVVSGPGPFRYQWQHNGVNIPGASNAVFVIPSTTPLHAGEYRVVVLSSANAVVSRGATLTVLVGVAIEQQPQSQTVRAGNPVSFTVSAVSSSTIRYQWRFNGTNLPGATNTALVINRVTNIHDGIYSVVLTDALGSLNSLPAQLTVLLPPVLEAPVPPVHLTAVAGETLTLGVQLQGNLPIYCRWRLFRSGLPGQILSDQILTQRQSYITIPVTTSSAGAYTVILTNSIGGFMNVARTNAILTVLTDTDGDLLPDDYEAGNGLRYDDPSDGQPGADADADGSSNRAEYIAGTDPQDSASYLKIDSISIEDAVHLQFGAVSNRTYAIQYVDSLDAQPRVWRHLADITARATNRVEKVVDSESQTRRYYRVVTPRQP